jgi:hypothetical protein
VTAPAAELEIEPEPERDDDMDIYRVEAEKNSDWNNYTTIQTEEKEQIIEKEMADYNENGTDRPGYYRPNGNNPIIVIMAAVIVVLIIALGSVLIVGRNTLFKGSSDVAHEIVKIDENTAAQFTLPPEKEDTTLEEEWGVGDIVATVAEKEPVKVKAKTPVKTSTVKPARKKGPSTPQTSVTVRGGDRLNLLALRFYGNKVFWVYIYEANRSKLSDPDNIPVGVTLTIPASSAYQIDSYNPASVRKAYSLQSQILAQHRGAAKKGGNPYGGGAPAYPDYGSQQPYNQQQQGFGGGNDPYSGNAYGGGGQGQPGGNQDYGNLNSQYGGGNQFDYGNTSDPFGGSGNASSEYGSDLYDDDFDGSLNINTKSNSKKSSSTKSTPKKKSANSLFDDYQSDDSYSTAPPAKSKSSKGGSLDNYLK